VSRSFVQKHVLILFLITLLSCSKEDVADCTDQNNCLYCQGDFPIGVAVDDQLLYSNPYYGSIVKRQFNSITPGNIFKPEYLQPQAGFFQWRDADSLVSYADREGKRLHGHTLLWHQQLPHWMKNYQGTAAQWDSLMKVHIQTVVQHFKGKVKAWDVVNEAFLDDGTLRNSIWKQNIGSTYLEKAFRYAHQADPDAKLFYNDFSVASNSVKRGAIIKFLNSLKFKGVPVDGIGLQMHIYTAFPENNDITQAMMDVVQNDYLLHLSEIDISMNPLARSMSFAPQAELERQAQKLAFIVKQYKSLPKRYQFGITIWGVGDGDSWIRTYFNRDDYPLLFDDNYKAKPAYCKLLETL
jgi:endo-1,4-beta-xylanase